MGFTMSQTKDSHTNKGSKDNPLDKTSKAPLLGTCRCRHKIVFIEGEGWKHYWMDGKK